MLTNRALDETEALLLSSWFAYETFTSPLAESLSGRRLKRPQPPP